MSKQIVIAAGGTGGHLFPAQSLAQELLERLPGSSVTFMAKGLAYNARFERSLYPFKDIASGPIAPKKVVFSAFSILKGICQSVKALKKAKPDVVIGFGSYHSFPVLCAAFMLGIPIVLHEANSVPGKVNRLFSSVAAWTGVFFPNAGKFLKGKVLQTDIPLRAKFANNSRPSRKLALEYYGLSNDVPTLLVFGGSLGAKKLNEMAAKSICLLNEQKVQISLQVLHFTGNAEATKMMAQAYSSANIRAEVRDFEYEMQYAWASADVCLCRAGASTVAEALSFTVPAVFIPYPQASDAHQDTNAEYVASDIGGAIWYKESDLKAPELASAIHRLLSQPAHGEMKKALHQASQNMQTRRFVDLVIQYLEAKI